MGGFHFILSSQVTSTQVILLSQEQIRTSEPLALAISVRNGEPASFAFSSVNKRGYPASRFMDADVANLFHMPLVPVPPGIGLFVNEFGSVMNVVLSYLDGMLSSEDVSRFDADLRRLL